MIDERGLAHRRLLLISGDEGWVRTTAEYFLSQQEEANILRYAARDGRHKIGDIHRILGKEYCCVVFDMFAGFDPDAFAACAGTIIAGGCLVLLTPELSTWKNYNDPFSQRYLSWPHKIEDIQQRFLQRFIRDLFASDFPEYITRASSGVIPLSTISPPTLKATSAQHQVIQALLNIQQGDDGWPVVLQADRGRGKSSALALFVNQLLEKKTVNIGIYAPSKLSLSSFYKQGNGLEEQVVFKTLEELLKGDATIELLLIDEAATLPMHALKQLLQRYPKVVLSTTLHGYEGSGHGFSIRLRQHLRDNYPSWTELSMQQPIRYAEHDPLEQFIHRALLLDAALPTLENQNIPIEDYQFRQVTQQQLMQDEVVLQKIVSLLVIAHYQTHPSDLRYLLDGLQIKIYLVQYEETIIAAALTLQEGGFDPELAHSIHYGQRRPRGNLLPQSLINHLGVPEIAPFQTERIMRLVVHPQAQTQGFGSALLQYIQKTSHDSDYWSTSFALTGERIAKFWRNNGFQLVRIGLQRDKSSGHRSVMMVKTADDVISEVLQLCQTRFYKQISVLLENEFADIPVSMLKTLGIQPAKGGFDHYDQRDLDSYCDGNRPLEVCLFAIQQALVSYERKGIKLQNVLNQGDYDFIHAKIIENQSWRDVCSVHRIQGKKQAKVRLRQLIIFLRKCEQTELRRDP